MTRYTRRSLPAYRHLPGKTPHPERDPAGHMFGMDESAAAPLSPDAWSANEDFLYAVDLFNAGYFWEAHAFCERLWAVEETDETARRFLQGLVQIAAACLKTVQGERRGAEKLLARGSRNLRSVRERSYLGVDFESLLGSAERYVESGGAPPIIELSIPL